LATTIDARVHCAVLKIRAVPVHTPPHYAGGVLRSERRLNARSLRTQQRARPGRTATTLPAPRGRTSWLEWRAWPNNQCSTDELPSWDTRPRYGSGRDPVSL